MIRKFNVEDLYLGKCRYCIMDIINSLCFDGEIINPRPDYIDYYTILLKNSDNTFTDIFSMDTSLIQSTDCKNLEENYDSNIILDYEPLSLYVKEYDRLNYRECLLTLDIIKKMKNLKDTFGYKNVNTKVLK